ncbi:hypothetical protein U1Q18_042704 [Sarracenia purpurea var. burkii]
MPNQFGLFSNTRDCHPFAITAGDWDIMIRTVRGDERQKQGPKLHSDSEEEDESNDGRRINFQSRQHSPIMSPKKDPKMETASRRDGREIFGLEDVVDDKISRKEITEESLKF